MKFYIHYSPTKLINFLIIGILFMSCNTNARFSNYSDGKIQLPTGEELKVFLAISDKQQKKGLSNLKNDMFSENEGMLFYSNTNKVRQFWMPNTHFDLDIVFLSKDLYVLDIHRKLKHFPFEGPKHKVPISKAVFCTHVLEIKSSSPLAKKIQPGMLLKWKSDLTLEQIVSNTHPLR